MCMNQYGISQKTGIKAALRSINDIIPDTNIKTDESKSNLLGRGKLSSSEPPAAMPCLFGESSLTIQASKESTAPCSETKADTNPQTLSDRLTQSLISAGLVKGITPMSVRKQLGAAIPDIVSWQRDGISADLLKADY